MTSPTFDRDGSPTDETLDAIRDWPATDPQGWLDLCASAWDTHYGKVERDSRIAFVTGGWSDNESIVNAMHRNSPLWSACWESSHRGGLHVFRVTP